jgi:DtxR family Mn-dependent transcriptional regulator
MNHELSESLEKYLLAIYEIVKANKAARVKDVSNYLKIGGPATSDAVKTLAARKFINYIPYGIITITPKGKKVAEDKLARHKIIANFLEKVLMIEPEMVHTDATVLEYAIPEDVLDKFVKFLTFMENCSYKEPKWFESFKQYMETGEMPEKCKNCMNLKEAPCCFE